MGTAKWKKWFRRAPVPRSTPCPAKVRDSCASISTWGPPFRKPHFLHFLLHGYRSLSRVWPLHHLDTVIKTREGSPSRLPIRGGRKADFPTEPPAHFQWPETCPPGATTVPRDGPPWQHAAMSPAANLMP